MVASAKEEADILFLLKESQHSAMTDVSVGVKWNWKMKSMIAGAMEANVLPLMKRFMTWH